MSLELLLALCFLLAVIGGLGLVYRHARRRLRAEVQVFVSLHNAAIARLVDERDAELTLDAGRDGWHAATGSRDRLGLYLATEGEMQRSTFIEYSTRLTVQAPEGETFELPGAGPRRLALGEVSAADLAPLALTAELAQRLAVATEIALDPRRVILTARPSEPAIRRYSYGIRLQLDPALLARLVDAGAALGAHLLPRAAPPRETTE